MHSSSSNIFTINIKRSKYKLLFVWFVLELSYQIGSLSIYFTKNCFPKMIQLFVSGIKMMNVMSIYYYAL